jgi:hypothetical protein
MIAHIRFCGELVRAAYHLIREQYYGIALRYCGETHKDAWLIARRQLQSKMIVNDFLRRI